ncbi:MAG: hypothetical protein ABUM51_01330 [Bacteroidota bacterium]
MSQLSENNKGSRFTGNDIHAFVVLLFIGAIITALAVKITFF